MWRLRRGSSGAGYLLDRFLTSGLLQGHVGTTVFTTEDTEDTEDTEGTEKSKTKRSQRNDRGESVTLSADIFAFRKCEHLFFSVSSVPSVANKKV